MDELKITDSDGDELVLSDVRSDSDSDWWAVIAGVGLDQTQVRRMRIWLAELEGDALDAAAGFITLMSRTESSRGTTTYEVSAPADADPLGLARAIRVMIGSEAAENVNVSPGLGEGGRVDRAAGIAMEMQQQRDALVVAIGAESYDKAVATLNENRRQLDNVTTGLLRMLGQDEPLLNGVDLGILAARVRGRLIDAEAQRDVAEKAWARLVELMRESGYHPSPADAPRSVSAIFSAIADSIKDLKAERYRQSKIIEDSQDKLARLEYANRETEGLRAALIERDRLRAADQTEISLLEAKLSDAHTANANLIESNQVLSVKLIGARQGLEEVRAEFFTADEEYYEGHMGREVSALIVAKIDGALAASA